jgi:hypothetical protein
MLVFAVIPLAPSPALDTAITNHFPSNSLKVSATLWLIAASGTAQELSNRLGATDGSLGSTIIFSTAGYYGRAPTNVWEWIRAKLEAPVDG